jgi:ubiquinone/menaquinone biosynthesis C-methylase UbiE
MECQLELISRSYDRTIDYGRKGIDLYKDLPKYITSDPDYPIWEIEFKSGSEESECKKIKDYLLPSTNMKFIDLGCAMNLMFHGYEKWHSTYYGVDISLKTIQLLNEYIAEKKMPVGSLYCGSIHETPFDDNYFDIGACIGVLEYFERDFIEKAIMEAHRIIKPKGKLVLDIPDIGNSSCRIMMLIEEYMGRPDRFKMLPNEFEDILKNYFEIDEKDSVDSRAMVMYCLKCKK